MIKKPLLFVLCAVVVSVATSLDVSAQSAHDPVDIERRVREVFADAPVMIDVARCESKFRQFADSGNPLRGGMDAQMVGIFQIYGSVHRQAALSLGYDIDSIEGNIGYARSLYLREGTTPWVSSMSCWNAASNATTATASVSVVSGFSTSLTFGMTHPEVLALQKTLNASGYTISSTGPGSPGQETDYFGSLTRIAVRRFQCDKGIVCSGDEYTTSYGVVGPRTRAALAALSSSSGGSQPPIVQPVTNAAEEARISAIRVQIEALRKQIVELEAQI